MVQLPLPLLLLMVFWEVLATHASNYCSLCYNHTMCITSEVGTPCRQGNFDHGVSKQARQRILHEHNVIRNRVAMGQETRGMFGAQPSASQMNRLDWDNELQNIAQRWANQCTFQHDDCRDVDRFSVGQNIYESAQWTSCDDDGNARWEDAVNAWYSEVDDFDNEDVMSFKSQPPTGHYTQVVWGNTEFIGCGFSRYQYGKWCKELYVCNYGPSGNFIGKPVYTVGTPRSLCQRSKFNHKYPGLC